MFERDKSNDETKTFDIGLSSDASKQTDRNETKGINKKLLLIGVALVALLSGGGVIYSKFINNTRLAEQGSDDKKTIFIPMEEITINLRQGIENNSSFLKIKVSLEVQGKNNYDIVSQMMPKIVDVFQTYLKELRKSDLDGSFGIYKIKDEMMLRINAILYPAKIDAILFQDFMMQVL